MAEKLTPQQEMAVTNRGGKLLVSAAAGSGKTKVLVDRLLSYLTDPDDPADIDQFLIITYTKAAASELRGKIAEKLSERIAREPGNRHLQLQLQRLYLTKISTVHAFCTDILREYAYKLDISSDFRVAEPNECAPLREEILERILDETYTSIGSEPYIRAFLDGQGMGRDDRSVPEIVLKVYDSAKCHKNPDQWLDWCVSSAQAGDISDASETVWGAYLIKHFKKALQMHIDAMDKCRVLCQSSDGYEATAGLLADTVCQLTSLARCSSWDEIHRHGPIDYGKISFPKKTSCPEVKQKVNIVRDSCKKEVSKLRDLFSDPSEQVLRDLQGSADSAQGLVQLVKAFSEEFDKLKKRRRILDFNDLEHKMLDLVTGRSRTAPTLTAKEIGGRFREIMVDEYQDSNEVQDTIFSALTAEKQNCFMVGDVKQSIYQFRLADPGIFLDKYNRFADAETALPGQDRKILLSSNFRSAGSVISAVNDVFTHCMSPEVGGLTYGEAEKLNEGIPHSAQTEPEIELYGITAQESGSRDEAAFTAQRIAQLLDGTHTVREKDGFRKIRPDDIVILLRSPGTVGKIYLRALENLGIKCAMESKSDLLQTEEVSTLYALLQIIDNPLQDIPLVAVLSSRIFCFTANDLTEIRAHKRNMYFYDAMRRSKTEKVNSFLSLLSDFRQAARMLSIGQLIEYIFTKSKMDSIYSAMSNGAEKARNLQIFCQFVSNYEKTGSKDLGQFLEHLKIAGERGLISVEQQTTNAVQIMSIHKSKGLEYPVVFLCGLSRGFNKDSLKDPVYCHKDLGLGFACVNTKQRVRYPSIAKKAIGKAMLSESLSEELRVLYVAMTRAKDRLIMTYSDKKLEATLAELAMRMDVSSKLFITSTVDCPGDWILYTALQRTEAGAFFQIGARPENVAVSDNPWLIQVTQAPVASASVQNTEEICSTELPADVRHRISRSLSFRYPNRKATAAPSKQTATQLKGRQKDQEAMEDTPDPKAPFSGFRKPSFVSDQTSGKNYGNTIHCVMQHIRFDHCESVSSVQAEVNRLVERKLITVEQGQAVNLQHIHQFFQSEMGRRVLGCQELLREFKFSLLDDGSRYVSGMEGEEVLLQGVVDCALVEDHGITILDFKSDRVTEESLDALTGEYRIQVETYAKALERIYEKTVTEAYLYFFRIGRLVRII